MYVELDLDFLGLLCQKLRFLLLKSSMNFWMNAINPNYLVLLAGI